MYQSCRLTSCVLLNVCHSEQDILISYRSRSSRRKDPAGPEPRHHRTSLSASLAGDSHNLATAPCSLVSADMLASTVGCLGDGPTDESAFAEGAVGDDIIVLDDCWGW